MIFPHVGLFSQAWNVNNKQSCIHKGSNKVHQIIPSKALNMGPK